MHLKNHKSGFSFIEMMVAITLLAIFGSSLFLTQSSIFTKLLKTHITVINMFETDKQLLKFNQQIEQARQEKKQLDTVLLHHENKNPSYVIDIKLKKFEQNSKLFKDFGKNVALVQATIVQENKPETWWSFIYTATPKKDEEPKQAKEAKSQPKMMRRVGP